MNVIESTRVILVEDDPDDIEIVRDILKRHLRNVELRVFGDSASLIAYLAGHRLPGLIICDLCLVLETGLELRQKLLASGIEGIEAIPFVIWSSGITPREEALAARLMVRECAIKDAVFDRLTEQVVNLVRAYTGAAPQQV